MANAIQSELSKIYGPRAITTFWIGGLLCFSAYHSLNYYFKIEKGAGMGIYFVKEALELSIQDSDESHALKLNKPKIFFVLLRALIQQTAMGFLIASYYHANLCSDKLNTGVITCLFTTRIVYSTLMFYFFYGQKICWQTGIGMAFTITCVAFISIGDPSKQIRATTEELSEYSEQYMILAIIFGLIVGFNFALNLFVTKYMLSKFNFPTLQMNFDILFA